MQGAPLKTLRLRSGKLLVVIGRVLPLEADDRERIAEVRNKLRVNFRERLPIASDAYAEASWQSFSADGGNVIQVIPVGQDSFAIDPAASPSAA